MATKDHYIIVQSLIATDIVSRYRCGSEKLERNRLRFATFWLLLFFFGFSFLWVGRNRMEHESIVGSITLVSWWKTAVGNRKGGQEMRIMASGKCPNLVFFFSNKKGSVKGKSIAKRNTPIAWNPCDNESFHRIQLQVSAKLDLDVFKSSYNNTYSIRCYAI